MLFMHLRKTGGTTLGRAVGNRFAASDCLCLYDKVHPSDRYLDGYRYVTGHVDVSFLERFRRRPYLITCLRDPIERALSVYSYYRWFPPGEYRILLPELGPAAYERRVAAMRLAREESLAWFLQHEHDLAAEHLGNLQTRALCGSPPEGGPERLDVALEQLVRCDFVALTERLETSAGWLARRLGWRDLSRMPRANVTQDRLTRDRISAETLGALEELTALDAELHRAGMRFHEQRISEWTDMADPLDPSASFPDASPSSEVHFSEPVPGAGWWGRERVDGGSWFSWIGDERRAWVDLVASSGADRVVVEIEHVIERAVLDSLTVTVNGEVAEHGLHREDGAVVATVRPSMGTIGTNPTVRVHVEVGSTRRPCDLDPASSDTRELSVGVRRIALLGTG